MQKNPQDKTPPGLTRHKLIVGACLSLAATSLAMSVVNLNEYVQHSKQIDRSFNKLKDTPSKKAQQENPEIEFVEAKNARHAPDKDAPRLVRVTTRKNSGNESRLGFADEQGKIIIPAKFVNAEAFTEGVAPAAENWGEYYFIDKTGKKVSRTYSSVGQFHDGAACVSLMVHASLHYLLIDHSEKTIQDCQQLEEQSAGYLATVNDRRGLLSFSGKWLIPPQYDQISPLYDPDDKFLDEPRSESVQYLDSPRYLCAKLNDLCGIFDSNGKLLTKPTYDQILTCRKGHATIVQNGKCGLVDVNGKVTLEPIYDFVTAYDDIIAAKQGAHWQFFDADGKKLPMPDIDGVLVHGIDGWYSEGLAPVISHGKCGFVDKSGKMVIAPRFSYVTHFIDGLASVWDGMYWRFIDKQGNYAEQENYSEIHPFNHGKTDVAVAGPLYALTRMEQIVKTNQEHENTIKAQTAPDFAFKKYDCYHRTQW